MNTKLSERLLRYDATALAESIRLGEISAVEVVEAHFERIEIFNKKCNALVTVDKPSAIQRAREADRDLSLGKIWGPLHGVPVTIKDSIDTKGMRTTVGYSPYRDSIPTKDAWVVTKLKDAGAIVIGKTNCATLCGDLQTNNVIFGKTNNPRDASRTAGGSSGGEAAAIALGMSPLGIGSDTGGSIRVPASYCGIYGFKPSTGKIPRAGLRPLHDDNHARQDSLTVVGPMARSVRDLTLCYEILSENPLTSDINRKDIKVFWTQEFETQVVDDEVKRVLREKLDVLVKQGIDVTEVKSPIPFGRLYGTYLRLSMYEFVPKEYKRFFGYLFWAFESVRSLFKGGLKGAYAELKRNQASLSNKVQDFLTNCDCWVLPATPTVAFRHQASGLPIPITLDGRIVKGRYYSTSAGLAFPFNMFGNPAVVIPVGACKNGLPIAIQLIGKPGRDRELLHAAAVLERSLR